MTAPAVQNSDKDEVILELPDAGVRITSWTSYRVNSSFLTPCDGYEFEVGDHLLDETTQEALQPGSLVRISINGNQQITGYIDSVETSASRTGGVEYRITGRDRLGQVIDSCADPTWHFKETQTLEDILKTIFGAYGFTKFDIDGRASRSIRLGQTRGTPTTTRAFATQPAKTKPIRTFQLYQLRPHNQEGAFAFASRITERFGLRIWLSGDGETIIVSKPDYEQEPSYSLIRTKQGVKTNILAGVVKQSAGEQPSIIVVDGFSGGAEYGRSKIKAYVVNPAVVVDNPKVYDFPGAKLVDLGGPANFFRPIHVPYARPLFLHDEESKTLEQLENFVKRELSQRLKSSLEASFTVDGHVSTEGAIWTTDTIVAVNDQLSGLDASLWVMAKTFSKSRQAGTTTELTLVRPYSLVF